MNGTTDETRDCKKDTTAWENGRVLAFMYVFHNVQTFFFVRVGVVQIWKVQLQAGL